MLRLCHIDDCVENYCKGFSIKTDQQEIDLFVVSKNNGIHVYLNQCPHTGGPIDWGNDKFLSLENDYIQCAQHGALFTVETGECVYGPCLAQALTPISYSIQGNWLYVAV